MLGLTRRRGWTLMEILVVVAIVAILAGILVPTFGSVRGKARATSCAANLSQISMAARMYYQDHHGPPLTELTVSLADYVDGCEVFVCPEDRGQADSYSEFFVARPTPTADQFVVGCPRHMRRKSAVVALGKGDTSTGATLGVTWNGEEIHAGDMVTGGELAFADGSRVTISPDLTVGMLVSVNNHGRAYSIIWVPEGTEGQVDCEVTPGSSFEVITPAAIAGVQGTRFTVYIESTPDTSVAPGDATTGTQVHDGKVLVEHRTKKLKKLLREGESQVVKETNDKTPKGKKGKKGNHR